MGCCATLARAGRVFLLLFASSSAPTKGKDILVFLPQVRMRAQTQTDQRIILFGGNNRLLVQTRAPRTKQKKGPGFRSNINTNFPWDLFAEHVQVRVSVRGSGTNPHCTPSRLCVLDCLPLYLFR